VQVQEVRGAAASGAQHHVSSAAAGETKKEAKINAIITTRAPIKKRPSLKVLSMWRRQAVAQKFARL
jgi:hypothetical protein